MIKAHVGIQARLNSSRLPRKTAMPFGAHPSLIEHIYNQWKIKFPEYLTVILAPENEKNDPFWKSLNQTCEIFFGDDNNLLKRYLSFSKEYKANTIIRATGDNPFVHKELVSRSLDLFLNSDYEYLSSKSDDGCNVPQGVGVEIFKYETLKRVALSTDVVEQEHVSEAFSTAKNIKCGYLKDPFNAGSIKLLNSSLTKDHLCQYNLLKGLF